MRPTWLRESISDDNGQADIAYVGLAAIIVLFALVSGFLLIMTAIGYGLNRPFDPLPLAQAFSLVCAAVFTTGLAGLSAYMLVTRKPRQQQPDQNVFATNAQVNQQAAPKP